MNVAAVDTLAGLSFPDPYRWLETDAERSRRWQTEQAQKAAAYAEGWSHYPAVRASVASFLTDRNVPVPRFAGGHWFRIHTGESSAATVVVSTTPMGEGRVLFDPVREDSAQPPVISWISPAPDGRTLAIGVCRDGTERNTILLVDVASGAILDHPPEQILPDSWTGGAQWLPDGSGFFFTSLVGDPADFCQQVCLHLRTPGPSTSYLDIPWSFEGDYRAVFVSTDGKWAVATERMVNPLPVAIARLDAPSLRWRPFVNNVMATVAGHAVGDEFIAVTDLGAPTGRLVGIPLDGADPNDPSNWRELLGAGDAVLRSVTPVASVLYLSELRDTFAEVRILSRSGAELGLVPLPGAGALDEPPHSMMALCPKGHPSQFVFGFSTLTHSSAVYRHLPNTDTLDELAAPRIRIEGGCVQSRRTTSSDGTIVHYHLLYVDSAASHRPRPTLIHAYGGFNVPFVPQFPGALAAFVAAGGVLVHAHLRGGGEFGRAFWEAGRGAGKHKSYEDLYAVAEALIADGITSAAQLALTGASNGGLLCGVAVTQRPELWAAVAARVPLLDLIGACRDSYGRACIQLDFADPDDPDDVRRLASISPYHRITAGTRYPGVFVSAGAGDPRCPAWHARKFVARLQAAQAADAPILLHVRDGGGHGWATRREAAIDEYAEWIAFTMQQLRLVPGGDSTC